MMHVIAIENTTTIAQRYRDEQTDRQRQTSKETNWRPTMFTFKLFTLQNKPRPRTRWLYKECFANKNEQKIQSTQGAVSCWSYLCLGSHSQRGHWQRLGITQPHLTLLTVHSVHTQYVTISALQRLTSNL